MWKEAAISAKGQITLPKEIREALDLAGGDVVVLDVDNGRIVMTPKNLSFRDLAGFLGDPPKGAATLEEIDETISKEASDAALGTVKKASDQAA